MNIFGLIETCYLERSQLNDQIRSQVCNEIRDRDLIRVALYLIDNLSRRNRMPGNEHTTVCGIIDWHREYQEITPRQKYFLFNAVVNNWEYLRLDARSQLLI